MKKITLLMAAFFVAVGINAQIFEEDFESGIFPPTGWDVINTHSNPLSNWDIGDEAGNSFAETFWTDAQLMDEWLITPSIDFTNVTGAELTFRTFMSFTWMVANSGADLMVKVSTDEGASWTQVWVEEEYGTFDDFTWFDVTVSLSDYDGEDDVMIAFHYLGDDGAQARVDDVVVDGNLSTADSNINGFNYYFSPQTQNLTINAAEAFSNISIFNVLGQQVVNQNLSSTNEVINLSSIKTGVYIVNVTANGQTTTFKLAKR